MGKLTTVYNGDYYYSHLHSTMCNFIMIDTHATKPEALKHIEYNARAHRYEYNDEDMDEGNNCPKYRTRHGTSLRHANVLYRFRHCLLILLKDES
jgi:hypothetical protein